MTSRCLSAVALVGVLVAVGSGCSDAGGRGSLDLRLSDADCEPGEQECVCTGSVTEAAGLSTIGRSATEVRTGVPCVPGDFDGNGAIDYAVPGAGYDCIRPVPVRVLLTRPEGGLARTVDLEPVACVHLYAAREEVGEFGEPVLDRDALVEWGEGGDTHIYILGEDGFERRSYASDREVTTFEERAIQRVLSWPASRLLAELPADRRFGDWLDELCGPGCEWAVELNDCGEQSGSLTTEADRPTPACVEYTGRWVDGARFGVSVVVGVLRRGADGGVEGRLEDRPSVRSVYVACDGAVRSLADLAELGERLGSGAGPAAACDVRGSSA